MISGPRCSPRLLSPRQPWRELGLLEEKQRSLATDSRRKGKCIGRPPAGLRSAMIRSFVVSWLGKRQLRQQLAPSPGDVVTTTAPGGRLRYSGSISIVVGVADGRGFHLRPPSLCLLVGESVHGFRLPGCNPSTVLGKRAELAVSPRGSSGEKPSGLLADGRIVNHDQSVARSAS